MKMKKENLGWLLLIGLAIVTMAWVLSANSIISCNFNKNIQLSEEEIEQLNEKELVYYGIDAITPIDNLAETIMIKGWAVTPDIEENPEREVVLLLRSEKEIYGFHTGLFTRHDIRDIFSDTIERRVGFYSEVSSLGMRPGVYQLILHCYEKENLYGMVHTNVYLIKDSNGISVWESSLAKVEGELQEEVASAYIDAVITDANGLTTVFGWATGANEILLENREVFLQIETAMGETYYITTMPYDRLDIAESFDAENRESALASGLVAKIPSELFSAEELAQSELRVAVKHEGNLYLTE